MTEPTRIFHNPRCSKSRHTLELLTERNIEPEIIRYLETPPTGSEMNEIINLLGCSARDVIRKGEKEYKEQGLENPELTHDELVQAMVNTPKLIERPIVIRGGRAVLGRPPENVLQLL